MVFVVVLLVVPWAGFVANHHDRSGGKNCNTPKTRVQMTVCNVRLRNLSDLRLPIILPNNMLALLDLIATRVRVLTDSSSAPEIRY